MGEQFRATVGSKLRLVAAATIRKLLHEAAKEIVAGVGDYERQVGMQDFTGNARRSLTIGIYEDRDLVDIVTTDGADPTMRTLRKGQAYPLPAYYDGREAGGSEGRYVGTAGHGGQWGPTLGRSRIHAMQPKSRARWQMLVIVPVEYASFDALNHIHDMLSAARDDMGEAIRRCRVTVKTADAVKDISRYTEYT